MGALAAVRSSSAGFGLRFLGETDGRLAEQKALLADSWGTRFEHVRPVREFPSYPGRDRSCCGISAGRSARSLAHVAVLEVTGHELFVHRQVSFPA